MPAGRISVGVGCAGWDRSLLIERAANKTSTMINTIMRIVEYEVPGAFPRLLRPAEATLEPLMLDRGDRTAGWRCGRYAGGSASRTAVRARGVSPIARSCGDALTPRGERSALANARSCAVI